MELSHIIDSFIGELFPRVSATRAGSGLDRTVRIGPLVYDAAL